MKRKSKRNDGTAYEHHVAQKMKWLGWFYVRQIGKSTFTRQAKQLAKKCNVELWERF